MGKLLYVDDEPNNLLLFKLNLEKWFEIETSFKPREAIKIIEKGNIEVLVTDQRMPDMTGIELAKQVKESFPLVTIIILTAYDDTNVMLQALNLGGIFRYLLKPWDLNDLKQTISSAFEAYELRKKNETLIRDLQEKNNQIHTAYLKIQQLKEKLEEENIQLKEEYTHNAQISNIVGKSNSLKKV
ncbi:MAG: response regulator [Bacteroidales bacterium]|nr:response regulator [Bacteroidales bacterium]